MSKSGVGRESLTRFSGTIARRFYAARSSERPVTTGRPGALSDSLMHDDFQKLTQRAIDQQLAGITKLNDAAGSGL